MHSNYGDRLKKSLERKTMAPLVASYQSDIASRQRAAALAEAERMIDRGNRYRGITDLKHVDTNESAEKPGPRSKSRESGMEAREVYMREESRKFNEQISSNMQTLVNKATAGSDAGRIMSSGPEARKISPEGRDASVGSKGSNRPSYIQKLLGLQRNPSASSGQYPFSIPSW